MNKVALCLSGQPRFVQEGYKTLSKNLVNFNEMDVFVHSWKDSLPGNNNSITRTDSSDLIKDLEHFR